MRNEVVCSAMGQTICMGGPLNMDMFGICKCPDYRSVQIVGVKFMLQWKEKVMNEL